MIGLSGYALGFSSSRHPRKRTWADAVIWACFICACLAAPLRAVADDDRFQLAVNYVFTGKTDPSPQPEIVDRTSCVVLLLEPQNKRYVTYYLGRMRADAARITKIYSGPRGISYFWEVESDGENVVEYLGLDKSTVAFGTRTVQIYLPGDIDQTERAINLIFSDYCKKARSKLPF